MGKLTLEHTGVWTVNIFTEDTAIDSLPFLTFELVILSGCKIDPLAFSLNKEAYIWPSSDYKWASLRFEKSYSKISWLSDFECQQLANVTPSSFKFIVSDEFLHD